MIQALLFDKKYFNLKNSLKWLKIHKYTPIKPPHITDNYIRFRLNDPKLFKSFRFIEFGKGVSAIYGFN